MSLYGVLTDYRVYYMDGLDVVSTPVDTSQLDTLEGYVSLGETYDLLQLWVCPGSKLSNNFAEYDDTFLQVTTRRYRPVLKELSSFLPVNVGGKKDFTLVLPEYIEDGIPENVLEVSESKPETLLWFLTMLTMSLGVPFTRDAKGTSLALLEKIHAPSKLWLKTRVPNEFYDNQQPDLCWVRSLNEQDLQYTYLHLIDVCSMYFAATNGLQIGKTRVSLENTNQFDREIKGLWLVEIIGDTLLEKMQYPPIAPRGHSQVWLTSEIVNRVIQLGYDVTIHGALTFHASLDLFTEWYGLIAAMLLEDRGDNIFKPFLKKMCNQMIGLMARPKQTNEREKWYNRPDIRNSVVAQALSNLFLHLSTLANNNIPVVYLDVDTIGFLSNVPFDAALPLGFPMGVNPGEFRYTGTYKVTDITPLFTGSFSQVKRGLGELKNNG